MAVVLQQKTYDPHLLYHAIRLTVDLEYKVPMQRVYSMLEIANSYNQTDSTKITPDDVLHLLDRLGSALESAVLTASDDDSDTTSLQDKIKELLRLLGCELSDMELNKILKGELSLDDALSKDAKAAWLMIFEKDDHGRQVPHKEMVEHMLFCTQQIAIENVEMKIQRNMENRRIEREHRSREQNFLFKEENMKVRLREKKEMEDPVILEQKRAKLRIYIAHMQGYDIDRDHDGGRGIDMTTGYVIDYGDVYIADKIHGSFIEDREHDGIDISDIR